MQLEDEDWLVKPPHLPGKYATDFNDAEWLVTPLKRSGVFSAIDHEDEEWLVKTSAAKGAEDEEWLVKPGQPLVVDALDSDFHFKHDFAEQDAVGPLHIYASDKNEADFQYVKDILKKSGFVRDVIPTPDLRIGTGSARSETCPDRGRLPLMAVGPLSRSAI
jgi:hypothetical protein